MERPIFQPVGTPVEELDTPALVVDLDVMDRNIQTFQGYFKDSAAKVRPATTSHLCPQIARRQLDAGGTVGGIAVTTLGEAEVFAGSGFADILLANQVVTASKIRRLCALAGQTSLGVAVDSPENAEQLSLGAVAGADLGEWLVLNGWAVAYVYFSYEYSRAEQRAKSARRGIWASEFELPWEWRKANR